MSTTNFGNLNTNQLTAWSRDLWKAAREHSFTMKFAGKGPNASIQRITELTKSAKGTRAIISLVADLTGDGVMGDYTLEDSEETIEAYDLEVTIDQLRNANRTAGRVADQKTIVGFRETSRDVLGYWLGDRIDQMSFLTLSGMAYTIKNSGGLRPVLATGKNLSDLDFASSVSAPTTNRHRNWTGSALAAGDTTVNTAVLSTPSYDMLVQAKAYAKDNYIRGIKGKGNNEYYHVFMCPQSVAKLKLDSDFLASAQNAQPRDKSNSIWSGAIPTVDGLVIHEFRHVPNTANATALVSGGAQDGAAGYKWGTYADTAGGYDGAVVLFVGAQALALADIGLPYWEEDEFDYKNQIGISVGKMFGLRKPKFYSNVTETTEDFGVLRINVKL